MVPCFKDMLIQATPENLDTFKKSMDNVKTEGVANLTAAFTAAFSLLKTYRETRGCDADTPCNQLVMLVTDGVPGNLTEVCMYVCNAMLLNLLVKCQQGYTHKCDLKRKESCKRGSPNITHLNLQFATPLALRIS